MAERIRWSLVISKETDISLRTYLARHGMRKGDLSKFVEDAVNRRVLQCTVQDIRERNADADPDEIQRIVDEAVSEVRAERRAKQKTEKA
jgi:histone acetyltransferase (RNA polymerase elongator complex component)